MALDLGKLEQQLDDALCKETPETLCAWLKKKRNKNIKNPTVSDKCLRQSA